MHRKNFIRCGLLALAAPANLLSAKTVQMQQPYIMTVNGPVPPANLGFTLSHEHVLVDFIGVKPLAPAKMMMDDALKKITPYLQQAIKQGCHTLVECTPNYLGRDPLLLKLLSQQTGLHIITNTGYYGAANEKYLPAQAYKSSAADIAAHWINEWQTGIEKTGIKPGFIKSGVDKAPLSAMQQKLIRAACITHLATGLTIGVHSGDGAAALQELAIIEEMKVDPSAWIWIHAQNETDRKIHLQVAQKGGWVSFDGMNEDTVEQYTSFISHMRDAGLLHKILISHDAGWYQAGKENGGDFRAYSAVFTHLIPALQTQGFSQQEIDQVFVKNPAKAFAISIKTRG